MREWYPSLVEHLIELYRSIRVYLEEKSAVDSSDRFQDMILNNRDDNVPIVDGYKLE